MIKFRAVKSNTSNTIICIGNDEDQGGNDYNNGEGTWCDFTFNECPDIIFDDKTKVLIDEFNEWIIHNTPFENYTYINNFSSNLLRVVGDKIVLKTESQIKNMINETKVELEKYGYTIFYINTIIKEPEPIPPVIEEEEVEELGPVTFEDAIREAI